MVAEDGEELSVALLPKVESILDRRQQLKRQRRNLLLQTFWRTGATFSFMAVLGWGLAKPDWEIKSLDQVNILGNTQLSTQTLERLLPITYPSSLIRIEPQAIATQLQQYGHVGDVAVSRQLLPPKVNIVVKERPPVAKVRCKNCLLAHKGQTPFEASDLWLIDEAGIALPLESYPELKRTQSLPQLEIYGYLLPQKSADARSGEQVVGINPQEQQRLQTMLPLLLGSPVPIQRLDWRDKTNLKVHTPLGTAHLFHSGEDAERLRDQLETLDKLRSLPETIDFSKVDFMDLSDLERPTLILKNKPGKTTVAIP